jgi:hypothetical protein
MDRDLAAHAATHRTPVDDHALRIHSTNPERADLGVEQRQPRCGKRTGGKHAQHAEISGFRNERAALSIGHGPIRPAVFQRTATHSAECGNGIAGEVGQLDRNVDAIHEHECTILQLHAVRHLTQRRGEPRGGGAGEVDGGELCSGQARKEREAERDGGG